MHIQIQNRTTFQMLGCKNAKPCLIMSLECYISLGYFSSQFNILTSRTTVYKLKNLSYVMNASYWTVLLPSMKKYAYKVGRQKSKVK